MSHRDELLRQAMALPAEDRAYVVTILARSLAGADEAIAGDLEMPGDALAGEALQAELERRSLAYRAGTTVARGAAEVIADLKARQASEQSA